MSLWFGASSADEEVMELTRKLSNDLLVLGKHGYGGVEKVLLGSSANRLLGHPERDMRVVPVR